MTQPSTPCALDCDEATAIEALVHLLGRLAWQQQSDFLAMTPALSASLSLKYLGKNNLTKWTAEQGNLAISDNGRPLAIDVAEHVL